MKSFAKLQLTLKTVVDIDSRILSLTCGGIYGLYEEEFKKKKEIIRYLIYAAK